MGKILLVSADCNLSRVNRFTELQTNYCWIYAGNDVRLRIFWEKHLSGVQPRISMGYRLQKAADDLSDDFNEWIDDLGRLHNSLGWWIGQISEKNPFVSTLFFHLCYLKIITDQLKIPSNTNWLVVVENHGLRRALIAYARDSNLDMIEIDRWSSELSATKQLVINAIYGILSRVMLVKNWLTLRRVIRDLCSSQSELDVMPDDCEGSILFHSWLGDDNVGDDGQFVDRFFGVLPYYLRDKGYRVKYFFLPLSVIAREAKLYDILRPLADSDFLFPSHLYLKFIDVFKALLFPLIFCWLPRRVPKFRTWSVRYLIDEDRWSQVWSSRTSAAYLYYAFAIRLGNNSKRVNRIYGTFENHIWEKAMYLGMRQSDVAERLIGYQHTTLHWNYHCYSPKSFELQTGVLPDQIVCTGSYWSDELLRRGYKHVKLGGALRFDTLPDNFEPQYRSNCKPIILVTSNAGENLTLEVLRNIYLSFGKDSAKTIWIKIHPHLHLSNEHYSSVFDGEIPEHFHLKTESVSELFPNVDLLVYSSTSLCFEALTMGIPVLSFVPETFVDLDDLQFFPHLRCAAATHQDLRRKAQKILGQSSGEYLDWLSNINESMKTVFAPVTPTSLETFIVSEEISEK